MRRLLARDEEVKLMVRCAQLYYDQGLELSQAEVAGRLGINPTKVSRLLRQAQTEGIVKVAIEPPRIQRLELELMDVFGLRDVVVVPSDGQSVYDALGQAAAAYFLRVARDNVSIGLTPGFTIQAMIDRIPALPFTGHRLFPLAAESTAVIRHFYPSQLASLLMTKYRDDSRVSAYAFRLPSRPQSEEDLPAYRSFVEFLFQNQEFTRLLEEARSADIYLAGIGALSSPGPGLRAILESYQISAEELRAAGAVGMINYQFFDAQGRVLTGKESPAIRQIEDSLVFIPLSDFHEAAKKFGRSVIAVAGSPNRVEAIRGALKGGFLNVLITDVDAAEGLLA